MAQLFKRIKTVAAFIIFFGISYTSSGIDNYFAGSRSASLSDCSVTLSDLWSVSNNQAGLAFIEKSMTGFSYERRFMLKELAVNTVGAAILCKPGTFGFSYTYFGYSKYHESKAGVAFSRKLAKNLAAGVQLDYFSAFWLGAESNLQKISYEIGILSYPFQNFAIGLHLVNPIPGKLNNKTEPDLPSIARLGFMYKLRDKIMLAFEANKNFTQGLIFNAGIEYVPVNLLSLRFGISSGTLMYSFGLGYQSKRLWFGAAFSDHQALGFTPRIDLGFNF